jgi:hypothetical protein
VGDGLTGLVERNLLIVPDQEKHAVLINIKAAKHHDLHWQKAMLSCKHWSDNREDPVVNCSERNTSE